MEPDDLDGGGWAAVLAMVKRELPFGGAIVKGLLLLAVIAVAILLIYVVYTFGVQPVIDLWGESAPSRDWLVRVGLTAVIMVAQAVLLLALARIILMRPVNKIHAKGQAALEEAKANVVKSESLRDEALALLEKAKVLLLDSGRWRGTEDQSVVVTEEPVDSFVHPAVEDLFERFPINDPWIREWLRWRTGNIFRKVDELLAEGGALSGR